MRSRLTWRTRSSERPCRLICSAMPPVRPATGRGPSPALRAGPVRPAWARDACSRAGDSCSSPSPAPPAAVKGRSIPVLAGPAAAALALYSAARGINKISWPLTMLSYVISALPVFWLGYIAIYFFTHKLGLFPLAFGFSGGGKKWLYMLLPVFVLGVGNGTISEVIRYLRAEMGRVMAEDYIRTAKAKGASVWKHAFKEGLLIPVTEIVASKIPFILGGAVIVEQVFNWPGMGRMAWQAAQDRDYPVIMGIAIMAAVFVRLGSLFQSVVYVAVNPRASKE